MTNKAPENHAALYYSPDAYTIKGEHVNGRQAAGESFLGGFFDHFHADIFDIVVSQEAYINELVNYLSKTKRELTIRKHRASRPEQIAKAGNLFILDPNINELNWARHSLGDHTYSICGYTHTISNFSFTKLIQNNRVSPLQEWDGMICTSNAVKTALNVLEDYQDEYFVDRFGKTPPRPQKTVIPIGLSVEKFGKNETNRQNGRDQLKCGDNEIVFMTLARLSANSKFDPIPAFIAMQKAQEKLGKSVQLRYVMTGWYDGTISRSVFEEGAARFMPDVIYTFVDGRKETHKFSMLAASDALLFPIENIQESFGIAPIEAMASGLPVITTDWDGMKDTVTPDVGFRIPTTMVGEPSSNKLGWLKQNNLIDDYQLNTHMSTQTTFDIPKMADAIYTLASNDDLRHTMSKAALKRAKSHYDWSVVIPQMQDFFGELTKIRNFHSEGKSRNPLPRLMSPEIARYLACFPTHVITEPIQKIRATQSVHDPKSVWDARQMDRSVNKVKPSVIEKLVKFYDLLKAKEGSFSLKDAGDPELTPDVFTIYATWLIKYDLAELAE